MDQPLRDKISYFRELQALNEGEDAEEPEDVDIRAFLRKESWNPLEFTTSIAPVARHLSSQAFETPPVHTRLQVHRSLRRTGSAPTPASIDVSIVRETPPVSYLPRLRSADQEVQTPLHVGKKLHPALKRIESAPIPSSATSVIKETPLNARISTLRRSLATTTTPVVAEASIIKETPLPGTSNRSAVEKRTASAPILGTPILGTPSSINISNISIMAGKRKRKETIIKLKPENEQIFKGLTFYYIPPDDIAPARRTRITKAREYGVTWVKELVPEVTHIIVDKNLTYQDVMAFLKLDKLPPDVIFVNENYPIDCYGPFKGLLPHKQLMYTVKGYEEASESPSHVDVPLPTKPSEANKSLELAQPETRPGKWDYVVPKQTPPRSAESTQESRRKTIHAELPVSSGKSPRPIDQLDELFETAKKLQHLPLDEDDYNKEDDSRPSSRDKDTDDSGSDSPAPARKVQKTKTSTNTKNSKLFNQAKFGCMKGGTGEVSSSNPNFRTIEILQEMGDRYEMIGDTWRTRAYRNAVGTLRQSPKQICTYEEALDLPNIGARLASKIEEIVRTNSLRRLESAKAEPTDHILKLFLNIYGVGNSQAWKWIQQGYKTLDDLTSKAKLTSNQLLGIEHYDDLLTRIPREEVTELAAIVTKAASEIDPEVKVIIGGSYRRGATSSGDLDCILTKPGTKSSEELLSFLSTLIQTLTRQKLLVAALSVPHAPRHNKSRPAEPQSGSKWHGCCILPSSAEKIWRRIDFLVVPGSQLGAALIYFTGDDLFNRSMRLLASRKGMRLNQRGLYGDVMRGEGRIRVTDGQLIEGADELEIFKRLGVPWRPPHERILS